MKLLEHFSDLRARKSKISNVLPTITAGVVSITYALTLLAARGAWVECTGFIALTVLLLSLLSHVGSNSRSAYVLAVCAVVASLFLKGAVEVIVVFSVLANTRLGAQERGIRCLWLAIIIAGAISAVNSTHLFYFSTFAVRQSLGLLSEASGTTVAQAFVITVLLSLLVLIPKHNRSLTKIVLTVVAIVTTVLVPGIWPISAAFAVVITYFIDGDIGPRDLLKAPKWAVLLLLLGIGITHQAISPVTAELPGPTLLVSSDMAPYTYAENQSSGASFANFRATLQLMNGSVNEVDSLRSEVIKDARLLVVINPLVEPTEQEIANVEAFVRRGGILLVAGDHTDIGGIMKPLNKYLSFTAIRFRFDSAIPFDTNWRWLGRSELAYGRWTPDTEDLSSIGYSVGATLAVGTEAEVLAVGTDCFADVGDPHYGTSKLGNLKHDKSELVGDLALIAMQSVGNGRVIVFGDTSPFQDSSVLYSWPQTLGSIGRWIHRGPSQEVLRSVILISLAILVLSILVLDVPAAGLLFVLAITPLGNQPAPRLPTNHDSAVIYGKSGLAYHKRSQENSLAELCKIVNTDRPLLLDRDGLELLRAGKEALIFVFASPMTVGSEDVFDISEKVAAGGNLVVAAGNESRDALASLLEHFGARIGQVRLGSAHAAEVKDVTAITDVGNLPVRFKDAWSLEVDRTWTTIVDCWSHPVVVSKRYGRGRVTVIGDPRFLNDESLKTTSTANAILLRNLLSRADKFGKYDER